METTKKAEKLYTQDKDNCGRCFDIINHTHKHSEENHTCKKSDAEIFKLIWLYYVPRAPMHTEESVLVEFTPKEKQREMFNSLSHFAKAKIHARIDMLKELGLIRE